MRRRLRVFSILVLWMQCLAVAFTAQQDPVTVHDLTWPWAWGNEPVELHVVRLRLDAGERTARVYLGVGEIAGSELRLTLDLAGPRGKAVWSYPATVKPKSHYALDLRVPAETGKYTLKATLAAGGTTASSSALEFEKRVHPAAMEPPLRQTVALRFSEDEKKQRTAGPWPIAVGVSFPRGALTSDEHLRVLAPDGKEVPAQVETLFRWYRDAPEVKWALLQFQPALKRGQGDYRVEFGTAVHRAKVKPAPELATRAQDLATRWIREGAYLVRADGTAFFARNDKADAKIELEESGPLVATVKATGRYVDDQGAPLCRYESRLSVFRGQPAVRIYFTLIWTEHSEVVARDIGIPIPAGFRGTRVAAGSVGTHNVPADGSVVLLQDGWNHCRIASKTSKGLTTLSEGQTSPGFLALQSNGKRAAVFMRDMGRNVPAEIEATAEALILHLWAGDAKPLSWKVKDVVTPIVRDYYGDKVANSYLTGGPLNTNDSSEKSPFGVAKTLEFWVLPAEAPGDPAVINGLVQEPLVMLADPKWLEQTQVWGPWHAYDPQNFGELEESLELAFDWVAALRAEYGDHGWFNYGDVHMGRSGTYVKDTPYAPLHEKYGFAFDAYRGWACSGYDWPTATWIQFARTGKRKYFAHSEANARHVMDIDTCHEDADPATDRTDWKHRKGEQYEYGCVHWTYGPIELTFYTHVDFMCYCYCMTGYRRAKDVLDEVAQNTRGYWNVGGNREATNPPKVLCRLYEMTGDEQFLYMAHRFIQFNLQKPIETSEQYIYPGLFYFHSLTGQPEARDLLLHYANRTAPPELAWDRQPSPGGDPFEAVAYAYWATGDPRYLQYANYVIRAFSDGIQREGVEPMRGMMGASLPVIELGPMTRGIPALLAAMSKERGRFGNSEASNTALLEQLPPDALKPFPDYNHLTRVYLLEEKDQPFVVDNPYRMSYGNTGGEALMQVLAPSGKVVAEKSLKSEALRSEEGLRLEVPADGETGRYELRLLLKTQSGASLGNSFVHVRTTLGKVMYDASGEIRALYGPGKLWFYVPAGTRQFTLAVQYFCGGGFVLRDADNTRVAGVATHTAKAGSFAPVDAIVVDVKPGKDGRWWHLSYGLRSWPPVPLRFTGIPPYVAVREAERFVVNER